MPTAASAATAGMRNRRRRRLADIYLPLHDRMG
jgi:hypothetical protein